MRKGETKSQWIARSHEIPPRHAKTARTAIPDCAKAAQSGSPGVGGRGDRRHRRHRKDETRGREGSEFGSANRLKRAFDRLVTRRSIGVIPFVYNKSGLPPGGVA